MLVQLPVRTVSTECCNLPRIHTLRPLPVLSLSASSPPGPILLLRDFFVGLSPSALLLCPLIMNPRSVVMLSLFMALADETAPSDLRDLGFAAGSVISSREAMVAGVYVYVWFLSRVYGRNGLWLGLALYTH